ncbi:hypothetical protein FDECE_14308 [Fusarium decemcellulare]|nr:hypothetical protein FDECE_14308 [Fusarium decemcellulare]
MPDEPVTLDPTAVTFLGEPFVLVPVVRDILRTRYCVPGTIFLVEGLERISVSRSGRWQAVRLLLGDGALCIQALLGANMHRFVQTGDVALGAYIRCDAFNAKWREVEGRCMVTLIVENLMTIGWNESYRALQQEDELTVLQHPEQAAQPVEPHQEPTVTQPQEPESAAPQSSHDFFDDDDEAAAEEAFEAFENLAYATKSKAPQKSNQQPIALARDWHDHQVPLKLTTLRSIPHLPYKQNWSCNVLAIITSLSEVEPSNLPPHKQRIARLADPSTSKQIHLTVFLDPEQFNPRLGSAVLLVGVKNHRFDGGSLKKYESDRKNGRWWFENPMELTWCDVEGINAWWSQVEIIVLHIPAFAALDSIQIIMDRQFRNPLASSCHGRVKKEAIDRFLSDLSPWDLLYLRGKLRNTTIILSTLVDLPPEIICLVLSYLDINDFRSCRLVSKAWAATWTQDAVFLWACRQFFPGFLETYHTMPGKQLYSLAIKKRNKWHRPHCKFKWIRWNQRFNRIFNETPPPSSQSGAQFVDVVYPFLYAREKLAWQPSLGQVIVDDLRNRKRQRFLPQDGAMSGTQFRVVAISYQLLVLVGVGFGRPERTMYIVSLATKEWKTVSLPGPFGTAHVDLHTVSIATRTGQIMVFVWGGKTTQLDLSTVETGVNDSLRLFGGLPNVLPHSKKANVVFAVWACTRPIGERLQRVTYVVVKFEDGRAVWRAEESIPNSVRHGHKECCKECWLALSFACRKSDNHGSFALGIYRLQGEGRPTPDICADCMPTNRTGEWGALTFNVLTQTFKHLEYRCTRPDIVWGGGGVSLAPRFTDVHLWNEDLLLATTTIDDDCHINLNMLTMHPLGSRTFASPAWTPIRLRNLHQAVRTQVFQDDDFVVVPTMGGVSIFEPSDSPSRGMPIDNVVVTPAAGDPRVIDHLQTTMWVELKQRPGENRPMRATY